MNPSTHPLPWTEADLQAVLVKCRMLNARAVRFYNTVEAAAMGGFDAADAYYARWRDYDEWNVWKPMDETDQEDAEFLEHEWKPVNRALFLAFLNRGYPHYRFYES